MPTPCLEVPVADREGVLLQRDVGGRVKKAEAQISAHSCVRALFPWDPGATGLAPVRGGEEAMQEQLRSGWKTLGNVLGQATKTATDAAVVVTRAVAAEVVGARCLQGYTVEAEPSAFAGPGGIWKIYTARSKKDGARFGLF